MVGGDMTGDADRTDEPLVMLQWMRACLLYWMRGQNRGILDQITMEEIKAPSEAIKKAFVDYTRAVRRNDERAPEVPEGAPSKQQWYYLLGGVDIGRIDLRPFKVPRRPSSPVIAPGRTLAPAPGDLAATAPDPLIVTPTTTTSNHDGSFSHGMGFGYHNPVVQVTARRSLELHNSMLQNSMLPQPGNQFARMAHQFVTASETDYKPDGDKSYMSFNIAGKQYQISDHKHAFLLVRMFNTIQSLVQQVEDLQQRLRQLEETKMPSATENGRNKRRRQDPPDYSP